MPDIGKILLVESSEHGKVVTIIILRSAILW